MKVLLEICAGSLASALEAEQGGADRIELCTALPLDGLTPSHVTIEMAKKMLKIPVHVLIRPREGDFVYSSLEVAQICTDIRVAKHLGADGIVCGALDKAGNIDTRVMKHIRSAAGEMSLTFHRAFDVCKDPFEAYRLLSELGVDTILTSGQAATAREGVTLIRSLVDLAQSGDDFYSGVSIMPGCGIQATNIAHIVTETGATAIHLSAKKRMAGDYFQTDANEVRACRTALDALTSL